MDAAAVKRTVFELGADLCGIASIDRFDNAPAGFHPRDVMPSCKSVVVFARRFPAATVGCASLVPYTIARNVLTAMLDRLAVELCAVLESRGVGAVPTGAISPTLYDAATGRYRNCVSVKHCAVAAGLGSIGKNSLLITNEFGNMIWLSAVLCDAAWQADAPFTQDLCPEQCRLCIDSCPAGALGEPEIKQTVCHAYAFHTEPGDDFVFKCNRCRTVCPRCFGSKNKP